jgi:hypothetical protein
LVGLLVGSSQTNRLRLPFAAAAARAASADARRRTPKKHDELAPFQSRVQTKTVSGVSL